MDRLLRAGGDPRQLDRVVFTHHHMDHFGEIGHLLFSARLPEQGRSRPLTLVGSGPLLELVAAYRAAFAGGLEPRGYT
ncbi:MAG: MBL fold metallo-hydrolase, partial [Gemmatimonadetes bacterium]|nr:MBL fold metallo-hydrolase [Gemmatimonadota bacterium]NIQ57048.1 MBL fold metallo-hydrolase [Gemmatimonadota bacterium]NIX46508.1 MBL fold metallo-hydrolase [Gemmatimonadota bacterium]